MVFIVFKSLILFLACKTFVCFHTFSVSTKEGKLLDRKFKNLGSVFYNRAKVSLNLSKDSMIDDKPTEPINEASFQEYNLFSETFRRKRTSYISELESKPFIRPSSSDINLNDLIDESFSDSSNVAEVQKPKKLAFLSKIMFWNKDKDKMVDIKNETVEALVLESSSSNITSIRIEATETPLVVLEKPKATRNPTHQRVLEIIRKAKTRVIPSTSSMEIQPAVTNSVTIEPSIEISAEVIETKMEVSETFIKTDDSKSNDFSSDLNKETMSFPEPLLEVSLLESPRLSEVSEPEHVQLEDTKDICSDANSTNCSSAVASDDVTDLSSINPLSSELSSSETRELIDEFIGSADDQEVPIDHLSTIHSIPEDHVDDTSQGAIEETNRADLAQSVSANDLITTPDDIPLLSKSLPFLKRPENLNGSLVGDFGFDPMGLSKLLSNDFAFIRAAELKHARVAMLASVGFLVQQMVHQSSSPLQSTEALGIGLNLQLLLFIGSLELMTWEKSKSDSEPGDLGFDPMEYSKGMSRSEMDNLRLKELKNGRLAMIAIVGMIAQSVYAGNSAMPGINSDSIVVKSEISQMSSRRDASFDSSSATKTSILSEGIPQKSFIDNKPDQRKRLKKPHTESWDIIRSQQSPQYRQERLDRYSK